MSSSASSPASLPATLLLPLILLLFFASGCAALIYEVVWYQLLALAIGSSAISLGILLATFMGGLCLGSYFLPRLVRPEQHPLRVYGVIEFGIGVFGLLVLWGLPIVDRFYVAGVQGGMPGMMMRGLLAALMLLPPTFLMGASLPAISRFIASTRRGVTWWGWLYAGNTIGAVLGCMLAGFWLLRLHDQAVATYAAVAINFLTAAASFALAQASPAVSLALDDTNDAPIPSRSEAEEEPGGAAAVYLAIAISGAAALGAQVVWTRYLAMLFGQTVYAFSAILAVFLAGLAIGGGIGALLLRWIKPRPALAWSQLLLACAIAYAAYIINQILPWMEEIRTLNGWEMAWTDVRRAGMAILPGALLWGASFPFALAAAGSGSSDPARPVARVYAANTFGAILGALSASLLLIGSIGSHLTQQIILVLVALGGLVLLVPMLKRQGAVAAACVSAAVAGVGVMAWTLPKQPGEMIAFGHQIPSLSPYAQVIETAEGRTSSVAITRVQDGNLQISVGGHVEATTIPFDMSLQRMIGHIPALMHPNPQKVLGIGFGAGVSAGSFTFHPAVKSITVVELEPKVPPISHKYFGNPFNNNVRTDPRTRLIFDDGRHFMMTTKETFDIIASDPIDVWVKGTAGIYSTDYFRKVKERLNPGGYFTLYVPLYESSEETLRTEFATFFEVFPNGTVWANLANGYGYDLVLMGPKDPGPIKIDIDQMEQRLRQPHYVRLAQSMNFIGFPSATEMYATYLGDADSMREWLKGAQLNTDRNMRLQYIAGWAIYSNLSDPIYRKMLGMRQLPRPYFTGSKESLDNLYRRMYSPQSGQAWPAQ
jgi:spermidine synthase